MPSHVFAPMVVAREELPFSVVDRLPRLPIEDLDDVVNVLTRMRRRVVRTDGVRIAVRHLPQRTRPVIAAARRSDHGERRCHTPIFAASHDRLLLLLVVLQAEMRDLFLTHQVAKRVLQLRLLDEKIVFRLESSSSHRRFVIEA